MIQETLTKERISWSPKVDSVLFYLILNKQNWLSMALYHNGGHLFFFYIDIIFLFPVSFPFSFSFFTFTYLFEAMGFFTEDIQKTSVSLYIGKNRLKMKYFFLIQSVDNLIPTQRGSLISRKLTGICCNSWPSLFRCKKMDREKLLKPFERSSSTVALNKSWECWR